VGREGLGKDGVRVTDAGIHDNHADDGGGIANYGYLAVENERLSYNTTSGDGGALANFSGAAKLIKTEIEHNAAAGQGGGIYADSGTVTKIKHSYMHDNTSDSSGGGIRNFGQLFLWDTTVRRNLAHSPGGGIVNSGELTADNSKIDENTAGVSGGGLFNFSAGTASLRGSEITMNKAVGPNATAGGISNLVGSVALTDTRVTKNVSTTEPGGVLNNSGTVTVDDESTIIKNRPTNCEGSNPSVPGCFGCRWWTP
jgi:predicted outer membrane repeat protein